MSAIRWLAGHVYKPEKQRPWSGAAPPGAARFFAPDRKGEDPQNHLRDSGGILQADAHNGF